MQRRIAQEPGRSRHLHRRCGKGDSRARSPRSFGVRLMPMEANSRRTMVPMREETKRSGKGGGKSERSNSTDEAGEPTRGTPSREGERRVTEPREGTTSGRLGPV